MPIEFIVPSMDPQIPRTPLCCVILLLVAAVCATQIHASPVEPSDYDGPSPGARSLGLGNAAIALKDEPFSSFYNPAALCFLQNSVVVFDFHYAKGNAQVLNLPNMKGITPVFLGMVNQAGGLAWHPLTRKTNEAETTHYDPAYADTVQVNTHYEYRADEVYTTMTTLATEQLEVLLRKPLLGINIKYIRAQCAEAKVVRTDGAVADASSNIDSGNGFGLDIGFAYATQSLVLGLSVKDAFSRIYWKDYDTDKIHTKIGTGLSYVVARRTTLSTDIRYDWTSKITSSFSGLEIDLMKRIERETKHIPVGETESGEAEIFGNIFRVGVRIPDLSDTDNITYSLGYSYLLSHFRFDIALMAQQEQIKDGDFSSQVSFLVLY